MSCRSRELDRERCRNLNVRPKAEPFFCSMGGEAVGLLMFVVMLLRLTEEDVLDDDIEL